MRTSVRLLQRMQKLIIDTDGCADDIRGLVMACRHPAAQVLAVTTVFGGISTRQAVANVNRTKRALGIDKLPVYRGAKNPLLSSTVPSTAEFFFGRDGIGDLPNSHPVSIEQDFDNFEKSKSAAVALTDLAREHRGQVTLICIGPLTNVALALKLDDNFAHNLNQVVIMGGNIYGYGNVPGRETAEFNFHCDPEAAHIVLDELRCPITLVPWEAFLFQGNKTSKEVEVDFEAHLRLENSLAEYLLAVTSAGREKLRMDALPFAYCDEIAVAIALRPDIVLEEETVRANVELQGVYTRGQVAIDRFRELWKKDHESAEGLAPKNVRFVTAYDVKAVDRMMHDALLHFGQD